MPDLEREHLVEKQWASGFFKTGLDEVLSSQGVDSLVVTGLTRPPAVACAPRLLTGSSTITRL